MSQLEAYLPEGYAEILDCSKGVEKAKVGIVIPTFGRPDYVERTLSSLAESSLQNCAVCIVDETRAELWGEGVEGFTGFFSLDSPGYDLGSIDDSLEAVAAAARENPKCIAFNSCGWLKRRLAFFPRAAPSIKLYVRDSYLQSHPRVHKKLARLAGKLPDPRAAKIVEDFTLPGVPLVKLFKRQHSNMFDSLKQGWQMLLDRFDCDYLVSLDSDTLVKPNWIQSLLELHKRLAGETQHLLVSGFHTRVHKTLENHPEFRIKKSVGGLNLLFDRQLFQSVVLPSLRSLQWDFTVCRQVSEAKGLIATTKPSVVDHIGRDGIWSSRWRFDRAADF